MSVYTSRQRFLHWLVAALVAGQFLLQGAMREAMNRLDEPGALDVVGFLLTTWHSLAGVSVGVFMLWRWQLRQANPVTPGNGEVSGVWSKVAATVHRLLYVATAAMVASGMLHYYVQWSIAGEIHRVVKWVLGALIVVHVAAALWHHWVHRNSVLRNMLGKSRLTDTIAGE